MPMVSIVDTSICANCDCADQWVVELGANLATSPFFKTLKGARETLVMLDRNADVLGRLWVRTTAVRVVPMQWERFM